MLAETIRFIRNYVGGLTIGVENTVEVILYLNYPNLRRMFSKCLRFNIIWKANFVVGKQTLCIVGCWRKPKLLSLYFYHIRRQPFFLEMMIQLRNDVELIPSLSPNVEDQLLRGLGREVEIYSLKISGSKCFISPFRV